MKDESTIQIRHLSRMFAPRTRFFGTRQGEMAMALDDVSLDVKSGERVALIGPNGAGKSTLLRILATLLTPSSGSARVAGFDVERQRRQVRASIGFMSGDDRSFFWPLSSIENLQFFASLQGLHERGARERIDEMLQEVGLDPNDGRPVSSYSSGMRQRLGLARALLHEPAVLLLDEPTANLDTESRERLVGSLEQMSQRMSLTVLFATHDALIINALASRTVTLAAGQMMSGEQRRGMRRYRLLVRQSRVAGTEQREFIVDDIGDGHALGAAIERILADGGEILNVAARASAGVER